METKICHDCWYYIPDPATSKILDESEVVTNFPYCHFYNDNPSAKPDDSCENWESKKFKMINAFKSLFGL
ncbi:MAG TPA: hypothetical protein VLM43_17050 [Desulfobacterales bacterium]|nr:hypothetical protein [Desulfobacterales bacterium]